MLYIYLGGGRGAWCNYCDLRIYGSIRVIFLSNNSTIWHHNSSTMTTVNMGKYELVNMVFRVSMHHYWRSCDQESTNRLWVFLFDIIMILTHSCNVWNDRWTNLKYFLKNYYYILFQFSARFRCNFEIHTLHTIHLWSCISKHICQKYSERHSNCMSPVFMVCSVMSALPNRNVHLPSQCENAGVIMTRIESIWPIGRL